METTQRQTYLDWLRILSIAGVLILHSAMPYVAEESWHIKNGQTSTLLLWMIAFLHMFRMPLLFFISGTVSYYMMQRRSAASFIKLRFTRLFIPLVVGMFVIVPPQIYMERLTQGFHGSYWDWYKTIFQFEAYPKGSFSWHHLWFIAYLFIYDILFAPLFMWLISPKSDGFKNALHKLGKGKRVYLLAIPSVIWYVMLSQQYPSTNDLVHDGCYFVYWLLFLLAGFLCILQPSLMDSLQRNRKFAITIGFACLMLFYYNWFNGDEISVLSTNSIHIIQRILRPVIAWSWMLGLVGYGKQYLNRKHRALSYLNEAVYPFYILHQTVIVILTFYMIHAAGDGIGLKYIFTVGITLFISISIFHLFIRPFPVMRFLFGMKPIKKNVADIKTTMYYDKEKILEPAYHLKKNHEAIV